MTLTKQDIDNLVDVLPGYPDGPLLIGTLMEGGAWVPREDLRQALYRAAEFWATAANRDTNASL